MHVHMQDIILVAVFSKIQAKQKTKCTDLATAVLHQATGQNGATERIKSTPEKYHCVQQQTVGPVLIQRRKRQKKKKIRIVAD